MEKNQLEKFVVELQVDSDQLDAFLYALGPAVRASVAVPALMLERYGYLEFVEAQKRIQMAAEDAVREFNAAFAELANTMASIEFPSDLMGRYIAGFDTAAIEPPEPPRSEAEFLAQRRAQLRADQQAKGRGRVKPWESPAKRFR